MMGLLDTLRSPLFWRILALQLLLILIVVLGQNLLLAGALALVLAVVVTRQLRRPIRAISLEVERLAQGGRRHGLDPATGIDLSHLVTAINELHEVRSRAVVSHREERDRALAILEGMVDGVVAVDHAERVVHLNRVAARLLGVRVPQPIGRAIWEVHRHHGVSELLAEAMASRAPVGDELVVFGEDERMLEVLAAPMRHEHGPIGAVAVLHDVSRLRRLETMRRDFAANVSHEFKTPITAIQGMVDTLLDGDVPPAHRNRFLTRIGEQTERLSSLVKDLLQLSRIEAAGPRLDLEPLDLRQPVEESVGRLQALADRKSQQLTLDQAPEPLLVAADREALLRVTDNLVGNAIKYTPEHGAIQVTAHRREAHAVLEVRDSGRGIEPREQRRIFERFYRVDRARTRSRVEGSGLGLSIVKHLVNALGGEIQLKSVPGRGSVFTVVLPLARVRGEDG